MSLSLQTILMDIAKGMRELGRVLMAKWYLDSVHCRYFASGDAEAFHYLETSQKGKYKRYHFCKGYDMNLIYVSLSRKERNEIKNKFKAEMGAMYKYKDTVILDSEFQHRFYIPGNPDTAITFMDEKGEIRSSLPVSKDTVE